MKKIMRIVVSFFMVFVVCSAPMTIATAEESLYPCYCCGQYHEWQFLYDLNESDPDKPMRLLCENCRKKIIITGDTFGMVNLAGEVDNIEGILSYYNDYNVIEDEIITILCPPDYTQTEQYDHLHVFTNQGIKNELYEIRFVWDNYAYPGEERSQFCFKGEFQGREQESFQDVIDTFVHFDDVEYTSQVLEFENILFFVYQYVDGRTVFFTVENGIQYTLVCEILNSGNLSKDEEINSFLRYSKLMTFANNIVFPSLSEINNHYKE